MADAFHTDESVGLDALSRRLRPTLEDCAPQIWDLIQAEETRDIATVFCQAYRARQLTETIDDDNNKLLIELPDRVTVVTVAAIACPSVAPAGPGDDLDQLVSITQRLTSSGHGCLAIIVHGILVDWAPREIDRTLHNQLFVQLSTHSTPERRAVAEALAVTNAYQQPEQSRFSTFSKESHLGLVVCRLPRRPASSSTEGETSDGDR